MKVIALDAKRDVDPEKKSINGVEFWVAVSPYFFPDRLECQYEESAGTLRINVRYLDADEEAIPLADFKNELVGLFVGVHTKRLLGVDVRVDKHDIDRVRVLVADGIPAAINQAKTSHPKMRPNLDMALASIEAHGAEIAEAACA